jgi:hypothetical protein
MLAGTSDSRSGVTDILDVLKLVCVPLRINFELLSGRSAEVGEKFGNKDSSNTGRNKD